MFAYKSQNLMKLSHYIILLLHVYLSAHIFRYLLAQSWCSVKTRFSDRQQADTASRKMNFSSHVSLMNTRIHRTIVLYSTGIIKHVASALENISLIYIYLYREFIIYNIDNIDKYHKPPSTKDSKLIKGGEGRVGF